MTKRIAFFAEQAEIENFYSLSIESLSLLEPHYNIGRGQHIPVITNGDERQLQRVRWGKSFSKSSNQPEEKNDNSTLLEKALQRCIVPISGFYIWKDDRKKDHPFFVRMMDNSTMAVAGVLIEEGENLHCDFLDREANTLIQPMTARMPLLLNKPMADKWLDGETDAGKIINEAKSLFLITDLTVLRVSKDANDLSNNHKELIQPIPK